MRVARDFLPLRTSSRVLSGIPHQVSFPEQRPATSGRVSKRFYFLPERRVTSRLASGTGHFGRSAAGHLNHRSVRLNELMRRLSSAISFVHEPCRYLPFRLPRGAPPRAPCIRQTCQPRTAGARQGSPVRFDLARHRGAALHRRMGLSLISLSYLPHRYRFLLLDRRSGSSYQHRRRAVASPSEHCRNDAFSITA